MAVCCSVLQVVGVLQCAAVCCSVLERVAVLPYIGCDCSALQCAAMCCSVLQRAAACYSVLQCVAVCCSAALHWQSWFERHSADTSQLRPVCLAALPQCLRTYAYMRIWTYVCTYVYRDMYVGIKTKSINSADTSHLRPVSLTALLQCLRTYAYIHICIYVYMYMHIYMNVCGSWPQHTHTHTHLQGLCCGKNPPLVTCLDTCEYINVYCIQKRHWYMARI